MLNKKILVGLVAVAISGSALADGFYAGAGLGGSYFRDNGVGTSNFGGIGEVYGGYAWNFANKINLGLEPFANFASTDNNYNYGFRVVPGYQITPDTSAHLLAGFVRGHFNNGNDVSANEKYFSNGYQAGVGAETNLMKNVALRGDVTFNDYLQDLTTNNSRYAINGIASLNYKFG